MKTSKWAPASPLVIVLFLALLIGAPLPAPVTARQALSPGAGCTTLVSDNITESTVWTREGSPYCLEPDWITIQVGHESQDVTLIIEEGVVVKGGEHHNWNTCGAGSLYIGQNGALRIYGTAENPVRFTRRDPDEHWGKITIDAGDRSSATKIEHTIFEYGGARFYNPGGDCSLYYREMLAFYSRRPVVEDSLFQFSATGAIYVENAGPYIQRTQILDNSGPGIWVQSGTPLIQIGEIVGNSGTGVHVEGGEPELEFLEIRDNGGTGVYLGPGTADLASLSALTISDNKLHGIHVAGGRPFIGDSQIRGNGGDGIWVQAGHPQISANDIMFNADDGLDITNPDTDTFVRHNRFLANADFGLYNNNPNTCIDARLNDWGDDSGPRDESNANDCALLYNPEGRGERVSDGVIYSGWLGAPEQLAVNVWAPNWASPGSEVTYLLSYYNGLQTVAQEAIVVVYLPEEFEYLVSSPGGTFRGDLSKHQVFWKLGDLQPGEGGDLSVTVRVPWGLPDHGDNLLANIAAQNAASPMPLDVADYASFTPVEVMGQKELTRVQVDDLLAADSSLQKLFNYAQGLGYRYEDGASQLELGDGSAPTTLFMLDVDHGSPALLHHSDGTSLLEVFGSQAYQVFDDEGGYIQNWADGTTGLWGTWAEEPAAATTSGAPVEKTATGTCFKNCLVTQTDEDQFKRLVKGFEEVKNSARCQPCLHGDPKDPGACHDCYLAFYYRYKEIANGIAYGQEDPGQIPSPIRKCIRECSRDSGSHRCTPGTVYRRCNSVPTCWWDRYLMPWKALRSRYKCSGSGEILYDGRENCGYFEICLEEEIGKATCGGCSPHLARTAQPPQDPCAVSDGDATCRSVDFQVKTAHDPNAKAVQPAGNVVPGQRLSYTVEYENTGQGPAYDVFVLDRLDDDLDETSLTIGDGGRYLAASRLLLWEVGTLGPGQGGQVTFGAEVRQGLPSGTAITNLANVHFPSADEITPTNPVLSIVRSIAAGPQTLQATAGAPLAITLTGSDAGGGTLSYRVVDGPLNGVLTGAPPDLTYTSSLQFSGQDSFRFVASNGTAESEPAIIRIAVQPSPSDAAPPTVTGTYPTPGQAGIPIASIEIQPGMYLPAVQATFSEPVDPETVDETTFTLSDTGGSVAYDAATWTAYLYPTAPLEPSTTYTASITGGIQDMAGNTPAGPHTWRFTTGGSAAIAVALPPPGDALRFAPIPVGAATHQTVAITSVGPGDLSLGNLDLTAAGVGKTPGESGGQAVPDFALQDDTCSGQKLAPLQRCTLRVAFSPRSRGPKAALLGIPSDDAHHPRVTVPLQGEGLGGELYLPLVSRGLRPPPSGWITLVDETFEGDFPAGWHLYSDGNHAWGKRTCRPYTGAHSGWAVGGGPAGAALPCSSHYPDGVRSWLVYGPFSLAGASAADLTFQAWLDTEPENDRLFRGASLDGSRYHGYTSSGHSGTWVAKSLDLAAVPTLGDLTGEPQVWIALLFTSDDSTNRPEGALVDEIVLRKYMPSSQAPAAGRPTRPKNLSGQEAPAMEILE